MTKSTHTFQDIINSFASKNILVIGDFILDVYLKGSSTRLSPEAPVPIVDVTDKINLLGGSANVVCNLRTLGASVTYCTVLGTDREGDESLELLESMGVKRTTIVRTPLRKTIVKTRVMSGGHVVTRFDQGTQDPLNENAEEMLIHYITEVYEACDAVFISDYDKGVITEKVLSALLRLQARWPKFLAVDSKRLTFFNKLHPYLAKPNYEEAVKLLGISHQTTKRAEQLHEFGAQLYETINAEIISVTLDAEGSVIFEMGLPVHRCLAPPIQQPHVAGAGDTYLSAFLLSYITSIDCTMSAEIANAAASIAVKKDMTSSCTNAELRSQFNMQHKYIETLKDLEEVCEAYRKEGKRIVFTNGCFDILHSGHVTYLHCAKELGDVLIVGLNTDDSIRRLKGETRPINPLTDRLQVLSGLTSVDHVFAFGNEKDDTPVPVIKVVKPNIFAKGGDYTKEQLPEASVVEELGGEIVFLPHIPDHSTTSIIKRLSDSATSDQAMLSHLQ
jgi:D-beta-D-heptose 7-phosphate kinase / D-beta-D-heptose 1-phosphate adenosyltransferase